VRCSGTIATKSPPASRQVSKTRWRVLPKARHQACTHSQVRKMVCESLAASSSFQACSKLLISSQLASFSTRNPGTSKTSTLWNTAGDTASTNCCADSDSGPAPWCVIVTPFERLAAASRHTTAPQYCHLRAGLPHGAVRKHTDRCGTPHAGLQRLTGRKMPNSNEVKRLRGEICAASNGSAISFRVLVILAQFHCSWPRSDTGPTSE